MIKSISFIIPYFNEKKRILHCLKEIKKFQNNRIRSEFIFVDDGSNDGTDLIINNFKKNNKNIKINLISYKKNMGKGFALKLGVLNAEYEWILTTDIDMSVSLKQIFIWIKKKFIKKSFYIYFGSREHKDSIVKTAFHRKFLGKIFRIFINFFLKILIKDTQCGFKLYKKFIAKKIFKKLTINKFEHDLEIVLNAQKINKTIVELPVRWSHKKNSKLNIFIDSFKMLLGIILLRYRWKNINKN
jgi:dolichyl-phosphate beta-glucosyltransferase